jgi:hypothetical protein
MTNTNKIEQTERFAAALSNVNEKFQKLIAEHWSHRQNDDCYEMLDPAVISKIFYDMLGKLLAQPDLMMRENIQFLQDYQQLWQNTVASAFFKKAGSPVI